MFLNCSIQFKLYLDYSLYSLTWLHSYFHHGLPVITKSSVQSPVWINSNSTSCCPGVAVWREHGGPAMCQSGPHRAHQEALQQRHRLLRQTQRTESRWSVDGRIQIPRLHGLEHSHERKTFFPLFNHSLPVNNWEPSPSLICPSSRIGFSLLTRSLGETQVNKNSKFRFHPTWPSRFQQDVDSAQTDEWGGQVKETSLVSNDDFHTRQFSLIAFKGLLRWAALQ